MEQYRECFYSRLQHSANVFSLRRCGDARAPLLLISTLRSLCVVRWHSGSGSYAVSQVPLAGLPEGDTAGGRSRLVPRPRFHGGSEAAAMHG